MKSVPNKNTNELHNGTEQVDTSVNTEKQIHKIQLGKH